MQVKDLGDKVAVENYSPVSRTVNTLVLPMTLQQFMLGYMKWDDGEYIQSAFPSLTAGQREFLMTGVTPDEWSELFAFDDSDDSGKPRGSFPTVYDDRNDD